MTMWVWASVKQASSKHDAFTPRPSSLAALTEATTPPAMITSHRAKPSASNASDALDSGGSSEIGTLTLQSLNEDPSFDARARRSRSHACEPESQRPIAMPAARPRAVAETARDSMNAICVAGEQREERAGGGHLTNVWMDG